MTEDRGQKTEDRRQRRQFKRSIFISLAGHLTVFSIFSFSFTERILPPDYANISFWGSILDKPDLLPFQNYNGNKSLFPCIAINKPKQLKFPETEKADKVVHTNFIKPQIAASFSLEKKFFINKAPVVFNTVKSEPAIMFYPHLPFYFNIYFNDRQSAHIELMFKINSTNKANSISIRRKISSGNLEVDLLVMRYISRYFFIQQNKFTSSDWQTVKIDFSPK